MEVAFDIFLYDDIIFLIILKNFHSLHLHVRITVLRLISNPRILGLLGFNHSIMKSRISLILSIFTTAKFLNNINKIIKAKIQFNLHMKIY